MLKKDHSGLAQSKHGHSERRWGSLCGSVRRRCGVCSEPPLGDRAQGGREVSALLGAKGPSCATGLKAASPT